HRYSRPFHAVSVSAERPCDGAAAFAPGTEQVDRGRRYPEQFADHRCKPAASDSAADHRGRAAFPVRSRAEWHCPRLHVFDAAERRRAETHSLDLPERCRRGRRSLPEREFTRLQQTAWRRRAMNRKLMWIVGGGAFVVAATGLAMVMAEPTVGPPFIP